MITLVLWGFFLLLAHSVSLEELASGFVVAACSHAAMRIVVKHGNPSYRVRIAWVRHLPEVLSQALVDSGRVVAEVARSLVQTRPIAGREIAVRIDPGEGDAESNARHAVVTAAASFAPNRYVIVDDGRGALIEHELVPRKTAAEPTDPEWPL